MNSVLMEFMFGRVEEFDEIGNGSMSETYQTQSIEVPGGVIDETVERLHDEVERVEKNHRRVENIVIGAREWIILKARIQRHYNDYKLDVEDEFPEFNFVVVPGSMLKAVPENRQVMMQFVQDHAGTELMEATAEEEQYVIQGPDDRVKCGELPLSFIDEDEDTVFMAENYDDKVLVQLNGDEQQFSEKDLPVRVSGFMVDRIGT